MSQSLSAVIRQVLTDATDANPAESMSCPYCGADATREGGPLYYWRCPKCRAFGTTWKWNREHEIRKSLG